MSDRRYNLIVTDGTTGEVVMNLKDVVIKSQSFSIEKPEDKAAVKVSAAVSGFLDEEILVNDN